MKEYKAILVGNGTMGRRHRVRFESMGVHFQKVLDVDASQWIASTASSELAADRPDFAVVASPALTHYDYARFFLVRGIPVLVEKPLAVNALQVRELVALSMSKKTLLFVAQSECYNPIFLNFRKHFLKDLEQAVSAQKQNSSKEEQLSVRLEFRREHGYSPRCRDVDVSLDLMIHDVSLFLNLLGGERIERLEYSSATQSCSAGDCCSAAESGSALDRRRLSLKVVSGRFAGVVANFIADRNSSQDIRRVSVDFGRCGKESGFSYSVDLVRYDGAGAVAHIPDSLDNEHQFFLKLLAGSWEEWAKRALFNAAQSVELLL